MNVFVPYIDINGEGYKSNTDFWQAKIENNQKRDQKNYDILLQNGWQVIVVWQCNLTKDKLENTMQSVAVALNHNLLKILKEREK